MKLSSANISIYQLNEDRDKPDLLRQTFSGSENSQLCYVGSDNKTVHVNIFSSTFNQRNSTYYVLVENNFVNSQTLNEPLIGIYDKLWVFSTSNLFFSFLKKIMFIFH